MCGIAGLTAPTARASDRPRVEAMLAALAHRGPDEQRAVPLGAAVLGTARLALVDKPTSQQPMVDPSGRYALAFNGEIYNFRQLRAELEATGVRFQTSGDTEVLLHALARWGVDALPRLRGQFAVAFWDSAERAMLLGRDRFGIVPLYWAALAGGIAFASEVTALRAAGLSTPLAPRDVVDAGVLWGLHPGRSVYAGVRSVPPGCSVTVRDGVADERPYWSFDYAAERDPGTLADQAERLAGLLGTAVARRVPEYGTPAVLLSGGLDSSAVTGLLRREVGDVPVDSYSIEFASAVLDESGFQQTAVRAFRTTHHTVVADDDTVAGTLVHAIEHAEMPLVRTAPAASIGLAARIEANGTRAVLSGEGADEMFCGYDLFKVAWIRDRWSRDPTDPRWPRLLEDALAQQRGMGRVVERAFYEQGIDERSDPVFSHQNRWRSSARLLQYMAPEWRASIGAEDVLDGVRDRLPERYHGWSVVEQAQYLESTYFLSTALLASQCDRPYMAHSIEARYPFLDEDVVDFALTLPLESKLAGLDEKAVLKVATADVVPDSIRTRVKQPYTAPEGDVFRSHAGEALLDTYASEAALGKHGLFDPARVAWLVAKLRRGRTSYYDDLAILWVLSTQVLADACGVDTHLEAR
jgi:asparagine synthase (glutamine-hydrolysing)